MKPEAQIDCLLALGLVQTDSNNHLSLTKRGKSEASRVFDNLSSRDQNLLIMYITDLAVSTGVLQPVAEPVIKKLERRSWAGGS